MTRLANVEKAGYFPLPASITDLILTHITAPHNGRILDPCAGKGTALVTLAETLNLEPFGVELNEDRAQEARSLTLKLAARQLTQFRSAQLPDQTRILNDSYLNLITSKNGYNLLYLNPPYDWDKEYGRLEYQFLWKTRPWLQPGGLLVYVIPQHILKMRKAVKYIVSHYEQVRVYRFPDGEYERFKQIVLFGVRRPQGIVPDVAAVNALMSMGQEANSLLAKQGLESLTPVPEPLYILPPLVVKDNGPRGGQFKFRSMFVDPADALAEARQMGASTTDAWRQHLSPAGVNVPLRPLTPLKIGHMNSIIAAGHMNNQVLGACTERLNEVEQGRSDGSGQRLLIKGRSYKTTREESYEEPLPSGGKKLTTLETEVVVTDITTVDEQGEIQSHNGPGLEQFLSQWIGNLTNIVASDYPPVYQFNLNGYGEMLGSLSKERLIPGLNGKTGLLPAQKHAAAAILTRLETNPDAILAGEMGVGKTTVGAAIAAGLNHRRGAQRTIVLCPPHLVDKWQREFKAVWPGVVTMHLQTISDVDAFFAERRDDRPVVGVLKQTTARSASGWEHAYDYGGPASHSYSSKGFTDVIRPWGSAITASQAIGNEEQTLTAAQLQAIHQRGIGCPICGTQQRVNGRPLSPYEMKGAKRFCDNPTCRAPLFQFKRRRSESQQRGSFKLYAEREKIIRNYTDKGQPIPFYELNRWSGTAVKDTFGYGKVPLAGYIKKVARGRLDLCLVDEQHQYKGDDSDQGYAMHHLALAARKIVGLTGTIYGGKASSIFHLLYRMSPEMTAVYTNPDAIGRRRIRSKDWVASYGILQRIETRKLNEDGTQTANSRTNVRYKELPGGSPAMLPWLLNRSVFLSLGDMGFPLPDYTEIPVEVPMAPEQAMLYETLKEQLKGELQERLVRGDKSLLSAYLYALLFWPDSPRRAKVVRDPRTGEVVASIPGLPEGFVGPKEKEIIELCQQEKAEGRKVLLLCLQTDTLDIQPEWKRMLEEAGLKTAVLRAAPNKREGWVEKQVQAGVDVIISHPKKVETGIDLLDFPTIVWMSPHYSVYTVLQASRRSWRIGQTRPVKVYYFAYADTIQEQALYLVAAKVAASLRVNGDTIADDSLAELDGITGNDIVATLARIVTGDTELNTQSLQNAFAEANASLRQANAIIGDYEIVDDEPEVETNNGVQTIPQQVQLFSGQSRSNGHRASGKAATMPVVTNGRHTHHSQFDGNDHTHKNGNQPEPETNEKRPPVPRPRLLMNLP
jgi:16S rRNA G966 N2-methylase RsmD